jgi:hypothetical protein
MQSSKSDNESKGGKISQFEAHAVNTEGLKVTSSKLITEKHASKTIDEAVVAIISSEKFQQLLRDVVREVVTEIVDELVDEFDPDAGLSLKAEVIERLNNIDQDSSEYVDEAAVRRELGLDE